MGCWNGTCGVSQLPIHHGDEVVLFILEENPFNDDRGTGGVCYSTGIWRPVFVPIFGKYNDYGCIEDVEAGTEFIVDYFNSVLNKSIYRRLNRMKRSYSDDSEKELQSQKLDDTPFETIEDLIDMMSEGDVYAIFNFMGDKRNIRYGFTMIHRHIYEELIKEMGARKPYSKTETIETLIRQRRFKQIEEMRGLGDIDEQLRDFLEGDDMKVENLTPEQRSKMRRALKAFTNSDRIFNSSHSAGINNRILDFINEKNLLSTEALTEMLVVDYLFGTCMEYMRKHWQPQAGAGSQCPETILFYVMNKAMAKVAKKNRWGDKGRWCRESLFWYDGP